MKDRVICFGCGVITASLVMVITRYLNRKEKTKVIYEADDECLSLFYGNTPKSEGRGFGEKEVIDATTVDRMKVVHNDYTRLPKDFYELAVEALPLVCVDIVCRRKSDGKLLLFYRRDPPVATVWWLPGGRIFKGETFYDTAIRKIRDETGNKNAIVTPLGVLGVWNTFFPDSCFDANRKEGRKGTQTINISVACEIDDLTSDIKDLKNKINIKQEMEDIHSAKNEWAVERDSW
eukprot:CAMPEP_0119036436 /NCGR_PEP_ID=MMETSP1177-20130426/4144_1 /TAXON_ID=2985 /ORGANISM="Ochromonas sp, Strain CCMP1899" /LENGTH=233 /DNA_ID=CAMNT_0006996307 /DNA_START=94 /DNA_END=792 /DNA_ORIENTATION=-